MIPARSVHKAFAAKLVPPEPRAFPGKKENRVNPVLRVREASQENQGPQANADRKVIRDLQDLKAKRARKVIQGPPGHKANKA